MKQSEMTWTHDVMSCPACGATIQARITARPELGAPALRPDGAGVDVSVEATLERFNIDHHCRGRVSALESDEAAS